MRHTLSLHRLCIGSAASMMKMSSMMQAPAQGKLRELQRGSALGVFMLHVVMLQGHKAKQLYVLLGLQ